MATVSGSRNLIGGSLVETNSGTIYLPTNGSSAPLISALLPQHAAAWADAITAIIRSARSEVRDP